MYFNVDDDNDDDDDVGDDGGDDDDDYDDFDDDDDDDDDDADADDGERKMMMWMLRRRRRKMMKLRRLMLRWKTDPKTGKHTLREPAQSKCTQTLHKRHPVRKFTRKMPTNPRASILCEPAQSK